MATRSEPNAQNSEINPQAHPSGARIERMIKRASDCAAKMNPTPGFHSDEADVDPERVASAESMRPSEIEDTPAQMSSEQIRDYPAEGERDVGTNGKKEDLKAAHGAHRRNPETREH